MSEPGLDATQLERYSRLPERTTDETTAATVEDSTARPSQ